MIHKVLRIIRILAYMTVMISIILLIAMYFLGEVHSYIQNMDIIQIGEGLKQQCSDTYFFTK